MSDLISRSALFPNGFFIVNRNDPMQSLYELLRRINAAPAVDAVPVVRCKDCKHFRHYGRTSLLVDGKNIKAGWCQRRMRYDEEHRMLPNDFCSYGERRAENEP